MKQKLSDEIAFFYTPERHNVWFRTSCRYIKRCSPTITATDRTTFGDGYVRLKFEHGIFYNNNNATLCKYEWLMSQVLKKMTVQYFVWWKIFIKRVRLSRRRRRPRRKLGFFGFRIERRIRAVLLSGNITCKHYPGSQKSAKNILERFSILTNLNGVKQREKLFCLGKSKWNRNLNVCNLYSFIILTKTKTVSFLQQRSRCTVNIYKIKIIGDILSSDIHELFNILKRKKHIQKLNTF